MSDLEGQVFKGNAPYERKSWHRFNRAVFAARDAAYARVVKWFGESEPDDDLIFGEDVETNTKRAHKDVYISALIREMAGYGYCQKDFDKHRDAPVYDLLTQELRGEF